MQKKTNNLKAINEYINGDKFLNFLNPKNIAFVADDFKEKTLAHLKAIQKLAKDGEDYKEDIDCNTEYAANVSNNTLVYNIIENALKQSNNLSFPCLIKQKDISLTFLVKDTLMYVKERIVKLMPLSGA